ncbi:MAG: iron-sulfur cluster assembly protein, partial [Acidimicrobiales bacterium]
MRDGPPGAVETRVLQALEGVRDPELDESVVALDFVAGITVEEGPAGARVDLALRLPTYFCASNFAYLMVTDAGEAARSVAGVAEARVTLVDHYAAEEINAGVAAGHGFSRSFPGLAAGELDELRTAFRRKALMARQYRLCRDLLDRGAAVDELAAMTLADLPPSPEADAYAGRRAELGIDAGPAAPLLVDDRGDPIPPRLARTHLRRARIQGVSIEGNAGFCRGLLGTRYGLGDASHGCDGRADRRPAAVPVPVALRDRPG